MPTPTITPAALATGAIATGAIAIGTTWTRGEFADIFEGDQDGEHDGIREFLTGLEIDPHIAIVFDEIDVLRSLNCTMLDGAAAGREVDEVVHVPADAYFTSITVIDTDAETPDGHQRTRYGQTHLAVAYPLPYGTLPTAPCGICGEGGTVTLPVPTLERIVARRETRELIQDIVPDLDRALREQLQSGTHPECFGSGL